MPAVCWTRRPWPRQRQRRIVDYLLYLPREYDTSRKWPLVVFLARVRGARARPELVRRQGPPGDRPGQNSFRSSFFLHNVQRNSPWIPERVVKLIEHVSNCFAVDPDRVYLTGYSMGGFGTWQTACYDPSRFAAIVPLCGGGDVAQAKRLVNLPIWAFHGAKDQVVPLEASKTMVDAVRKCGGHVKFTVYPGYGHDICGITYQDGQLYEWLSAQRRTQHLK